METKEVIQALTECKPVAHFYDLRLIKEIVQAVEDGTPRFELCERYGCSKATLVRWVSKYGSEVCQERKRKVYKRSEKRSVLRAVACGMSIREARISFGIANNAIIYAWMKEEKKENDDLSLVNSPAMAKDVKNTDSDEVKALKKALAFEQLRNKALNTLIDIAEEQFKVDIRKKDGARQSPK
ncbi:transposase [Pedobacter immunditicola]|uniref:transposase n=1 Tax=Pedobacter immunditicola TaxID=3133440 RepID=UPI0030B7EA19